MLKVFRLDSRRSLLGVTRTENKGRLRLLGNRPVHGMFSVRASQLHAALLARSVLSFSLSPTIIPPHTHPHTPLLTLYLNDHGGRLLLLCTGSSSWEFSGRPTHCTTTGPLRAAMRASLPTLRWLLLTRDGIKSKQLRANS